MSAGWKLDGPGSYTFTLLRSDGATTVLDVEVSAVGSADRPLFMASLLESVEHCDSVNRSEAVERTTP